MGSSESGMILQSRPKWRQEGQALYSCLNQVFDMSCPLPGGITLREAAPYTQGVFLVRDSAESQEQLICSAASG